jgi:subtilase family serine protease
MGSAFCKYPSEQNLTAAQKIEIPALAEQAAAEGITYIVSSGDSGSAGCDDPNLVTITSGPFAVNGLASTPFTVAVGGTTFNEHGSDSTYWNTSNDPNNHGSAKSHIPDDAWNESCAAAQCGQNANIAAGGGGLSTLCAKPSWPDRFTRTSVPLDKPARVAHVRFLIDDCGLRRW